MHYRIPYFFYCTKRGNVLNIWIADVHYPVTCLPTGMAKFMMLWKMVSIVMFVAVSLFQFRLIECSNFTPQNNVVVLRCEGNDSTEENIIKSIYNHQPIEE